MFRLVVQFGSGNGQIDSVAWYDSDTFEQAFKRAREMKNKYALGWSESVTTNCFYRGTGIDYKFVEFSIHDELGMHILPGMRI